MSVAELRTAESLGDGSGDCKAERAEKTVKRCVGFKGWEEC